MRWRLILQEFGPNIQHIAGVDNIVADTLSRLPSTNNNKKHVLTKLLQESVNCLTTHGYLDTLDLIEWFSTMDHGLKEALYNHYYKDFDVKPVLTSIKFPQSNTPVE